MGPRGRNKNRKSNNFKGNKGKKRKQYSLYPGKKKNDKPNYKRKNEDRESNSREFDNKRKRVDQFVKPMPQESSESESEEEEDAMKLLRESLVPVTKKSQAIDSSDDSESADEAVDEEEIDEGDSNDEEFADDEDDIDGEDAIEKENATDADDSPEEDDDKEMQNNSAEKNDKENDGKSQDVQKGNKKEVIAKAKKGFDEESDHEILVEENEVDLETQKEDENIKAVSDDPFSKHVLYELHESLLESVQAVPMKCDSFVENWPELGKLQIQIPQCDGVKQDKKLIISEEKPFAPAGEVPRRLHATKDAPESVFIKPQIVNNLRKANSSVLDEELQPNCKLPLTPFQTELFSIINNYQDLYFSERNFQNAEQIRFVYCLHAVNHILKTRTKVLHHNARLSSKDDVPEEFRDQGLCRPKILIVVPFRDAAYRIVNVMSEMFFFEDKGNVIKKNRFIEDYTGHELAMPKKNPKPEDYEEIFKGNSSDDFKIGITVTKKSLKLYANFYSSDIIIASPLGLRTTIGAEGEAERDFDFLASIELLILDQMEIFLMQNFHHILHIIDHLHAQPKSSHGTDFSRVRHWSLNGWAKYYRQTLMFSSMVIPEANSIFSRNCFNYAGKVRVTNPIVNGSIRQVFVQLPHVFQKFEANSLLQSIDARFEFFTNKILPEHRDPLMKQTLIFVPNYYDFVRIRNYFKREDVSFVQICEYSKESKVARARDMFYHGDAHFLLYTERFHFFHRIRVKGIRHLIFYQPPIFPHFYYEMSNFMLESNMNKKVGSMLNMSVTVIYSKYDGHQLASVVGTERASKMLQSDVNVHKISTKRR